MKIAKKFALFFALVAIAIITGNVRAEDLQVRQATQSEIGKTATCPVMHSTFKVAHDTKVVDYKGKSYYFCCSDCIDDFKKNPDKYAEAGELQVRQATQSEIGKTATCPVMHSTFKVAKGTKAIDYKGKSYYFCCSGCIDDFKKNPDKYAK